MAIQRYEEVPAVCENKECENYQGFELVDVETVLTDEEGKDYVLCDWCGRKIIIN